MGTAPAVRQARSHGTVADPAPPPAGLCPTSKPGHVLHRSLVGRFGPPNFAANIPVRHRRAGSLLVTARRGSQDRRAAGHVKRIAAQPNKWGLKVQMDSLAEPSASRMDPRPSGSVAFGLQQLRVALIHDWLITLGGADRVLLALHDVFPQAPVFVALHALGRLPESFRRLDIRATWLQRLPGATRRHRWLVPLMPFAFAHLNLRGYDVIVSSSHACAKGVVVPPGAIHVCYCHTPMRYAWDLSQEYLATTPAIARPGARAALAWLRQWDRATAQRVDYFIANSHFVAGLIRHHYRLDGTGSYPPVRTQALR